MSALTASIRKAAADSTLEFDWLLGDAQGFSFQRLSGLTGMSDSFLEKLWDDKSLPLHISGHEYNAGKKKARNTKRVARVFAMRLLVATARYTGEEKLNAFLSCLREFSAEELLRVIAEAQRTIEAKTVARGGAPFFSAGRSVNARRSA